MTTEIVRERNHRNIVLHSHTHEEKTYHSLAPFGFIAILYTLCGLTWFWTMVATLSYSNDNTNISAANIGSSSTGSASGKYGGNMLQSFYSYFNFFAFRIICLFVSLKVTYDADRHWLSRNAAWCSWTVNFCLFLSWFSTDLPFVYSALKSYTNNANTNGIDNNANLSSSLNAHFCGDSMVSFHWCALNYTHAILSLVSLFLIAFTFLFSCYQLSRARGEIKLLLTWCEVAIVNFTVIGILGYLIWNLASINLGITHNYSVFQYLDGSNELNTYRMFVPSQIWGNYLIHGAWIYAIAAISSISFGSTSAPRVTALFISWLSFFVLFPSFLYIARHQNEMMVGQCGNDKYNSDYRCSTLSAVAAGLGIAMASMLIMAITMFFVLQQVETQDYAADVYGDKALAIDSIKSNGTIPIVDKRYASSSTANSTNTTPQQANRTLNTNNNTNAANTTSSTYNFQNDHNQQHDVELGTTPA